MALGATTFFVEPHYVFLSGFEATARLAQQTFVGIVPEGSCFVGSESGLCGFLITCEPAHASQMR